MRAAFDLRARIKTLETQCEALVGKSRIAQLIDSIPGYGLVCSTELAGELGTIDRFATEASLAVYTGMANLDNSSGNFRGSKNPKHVNTRAKAAMMVGVDRHRKMIPESQQYYEKKRAQGKSHNQAIRALGRHLCRVIFRMLKQNRPYEVRAPDSLKKV